MNENKELAAKYPGKVKFFRVDVTKDKQIQDAVEGSAKWAKETGATLGGVINCAGTGAPSRVSVI